MAFDFIPRENGNAPWDRCEVSDDLWFPRVEWTLTAVGVGALVAMAYDCGPRLVWSGVWLAACGVMFARSLLASHALRDGALSQGLPGVAGQARRMRQAAHDLARGWAWLSLAVLMGPRVIWTPEAEQTEALRVQVVWNGQLLLALAAAAVGWAWDGVRWSAPNRE